MDHFDKVPEYALGASMVTAIGYILVQVLKIYGGADKKLIDYAERLEKQIVQKDAKIARLEKQLRKAQNK